MNGITTIFSDLGNVVVFFDNKRAARRLLWGSGAGLSPDRAHELLFGTPYGLAWGYASGRFETGEFRRMVRALLGMPAFVRDDAFDELFSDVFAPNEPVIRLWAKARRLGLRLFALSDVEEIRFRKLERMGVLDAFEGGVYSYREKALKKDGSALFEKALEAAGCRPEKALFVDDLEANVAEARKLGLRAHLYDSRNHKALEKELMLLGVPLLASAP